MFTRNIELNYRNGRIGSILVTVGVPDNWSISVFTPGNRFVLSPLEVFSHYDKIDSVAATNERPNKLYIPKISQDWNPDIEDLTFKAGFYAQMRDFRTFVISNARPQTLGSLSEAQFVVSFAQAILESD